MILIRLFAELLYLLLSRARNKYGLLYFVQEKVIYYFNMNNIPISDKGLQYRSNQEPKMLHEFDCITIEEISQKETFVAFDEILLDA